MRCVGALQDPRTLFVERLRAREVHRRRGHEADTGMPVLVVVPSKERPQERAGVLEAIEALGELGPVFERLELRFGERIVRRTRAAPSPTRLLGWSDAGGLKFQSVAKAAGRERNPLAIEL